MAGSVQYEISRADYVAAARWAASPTRKAVAIELSLLAAGVVAGVIARYVGHEAAGSLALIVTSGLLGAFVCGYVGGQIGAVIGARRAFSQYSKLNGPTELNWDDDGFRLEAPKEKLACEWQDLVNVGENQRTFMLFPQHHIYLMVPKAAFGSSAALADFSLCLQTRRT